VTVISDNYSKTIRGSARGSIILMIGQIASSLISAVTVIFIARIIGADGYGEYTIAIIPVSIATLIQDLGISTALTRFCARYRSEDKREDLKDVVRTGLLFTGLSSAVISLILFAFSGLIAANFLHRPDLEYLVRAASFTVFGTGLYTSVQAIFVGFELMGLRSLTQVIWSATRGVLAVILVLAGLGSFGAVVSYTTGYMMAGLLGILMVILFIKFKSGSTQFKPASTLRGLLIYGLPIYAGTLIGSGMTQLSNTLMTLNVQTDLIGNYGAAQNFGVLVSFLTMPIGMVLFPMFSKIRRDNTQLKQLFQSAVKYTSLVTTPVVMLLILLSAPLIQLIYGHDYPYSALYLSFYLLIFAFEGLGGTSLNYLLLGLGETKAIFISNALGFLFGAPMALVLIPRYQILGVIASLVIAQFAGWIYRLIWLKRSIGFSVDWLKTVKIYVACIVAFLMGRLVISVISLNVWATLIIGAIVFFGVYLLMLPISRTLNRGDLLELKDISGTLGPLSPIIQVILSILSRFIPPN
jgi:stage V sporulation protein B